jgi:hypothetical protein
MKSFYCLFLFLLSFSLSSTSNAQLSSQKTISSSLENDSQDEAGLWKWVKQEEGGGLVYRLIINRQNLMQIWEKEPREIQVSIPLKSGKPRSFTFRRAGIIDSAFAVQTSDGRLLQGKEYSGLHYQVVESPGCRVGGLSFREDGLMGLVCVDGSSLSIAEKVPGSGKYYISFDEDQKFPAWTCAQELIPGPGLKPVPLPAATDKSASKICKTVRVFMEGDRDLYSKSGNSLTTASNFVTGLFNVVVQLFSNEGIQLQLAGIYQWTSTDPYASLTNSTEILYSFANNRPVASANANLFHLLSTRPTNLGGVAFIDVMCNPSIRHGFSNIPYQYSAFPAYSYASFCMAHELGHNFGSQHTHWCGWTLPGGSLGRIDSCYAGEGTCGSVTKPRIGTIMSYCHIGLGVNLNLGFGPLPRAVIRNGLLNATCISSGACLGTPTVKADSTTNKNNSFILTLTIPAGHNASSWSLREGSTSIRTGTLSGNTAFSTTVSITGKSNGTYTYTMVISNGSNSSSSSPVSVVVAVPSIQVPINTICTATGLMAWFGSDGQMRFRFGISSPCTTYNVQVCRYNLSDPNVTPSAGATPVACGIRNNMSAYAPTAAEWSQGFIERIANPQPANRTSPGMGSFWYSVDVLCNSGSSCTTTNRTRTYIFVPGI